MPEPYHVVYYRRFADCFAAESDIHAILARKRVPNREHFEISLDEAKTMIARYKPVEELGYFQRKSSGQRSQSRLSALLFLGALLILGLLLIVNLVKSPAREAEVPELPAEVMDVELEEVDEQVDFTHQDFYAEDVDVVDGMDLWSGDSEMNHEPSLMGAMSEPEPDSEIFATEPTDSLDDPVLEENVAEALASEEIVQDASPLPLRETDGAALEQEEEVEAETLEEDEADDTKPDDSDWDQPGVTLSED